MAVIEQKWKDYSKLKYNLASDFTSMSTRHKEELSTLQTNLSQSGLTSADTQYSLSVDKLMAEQTKAQEEILSAQEELESGAIKDVLTDPFWGESYGASVVKEATGLRGAELKAERKANPDAPYMGVKAFDFAGAEEYLKGVNPEYKSDMEGFYEERFGAYTPSADEVNEQKSASSMAQARGVAGSNRSRRMNKRQNSYASVTGGNMFLTSPNSDVATSSGWWT